MYENRALRRQLLALHAQQPRRRLTALHKLFWVALRTFWSGWTKPLILVTPRTVVNWHRAGFRYAIAGLPMNTAQMMGILL